MTDLLIINNCIMFFVWESYFLFGIKIIMQVVLYVLVKRPYEAKYKTQA